MLKECYELITAQLIQALRVASFAILGEPACATSDSTFNRQAILLLVLLVLLIPRISAAQQQPAEADTAARSTLVLFGLDQLSPANQATCDRISDLRQAAKNGSVAAQNHLAYLYTYGMGVERDYREAARWYQAAADRGFAAAQYNLGALFEHGLGVSQGYQTAATYYQAAARQGHVLAQARLGLMYERGWGVPRNLMEATRCYRLAAE